MLIINIANTAIGIFLICILLRVFSFNRLKPVSQIIMIIMLLALVNYVPIYHNFNLVELFHGMFSDLSLTSLMVFSFILLKNLCGLNFQIIKPVTARLMLLIGLILYLTTLDILPFSLYDYGYNPHYILIPFILFELVLWQFSRIFAWVWLFALAGFYCHLQASFNLWDYLIDPCLWIVCSLSLKSGLCRTS